MEEDGQAWRLRRILLDGEDEVAPAGVAEVQVVRSSASAIGWPDVAAMTELAIALARRSLRIVTAYFTPDAVTVQQPGEASAGRGVAVEAMLPWPHMDLRVIQLAGADAIAPLLSAG